MPVTAWRIARSELALNYRPTQGPWLCCLRCVRLETGLKTVEWTDRCYRACRRRGALAGECWTLAAGSLSSAAAVRRRGPSLDRWRRSRSRRRRGPPRRHCRRCSSPTSPAAVSTWSLCAARPRYTRATTSQAEQGLTSHQTHYTSYRGWVYASKDPTNSVKAHLNWTELNRVYVAGATQGFSYVGAEDIGVYAVSLKPDRRTARPQADRK